MASQYCPCDRPRRIDAVGLGECGTRGIERGNGAVAGPQEAVTHEVCVCVATRDRPRRVDAGGGGAVVGTWGIERCEGAAGGPQEAVLQEACVKVVSRDRPLLVDGDGRGK